MKRVTVVMLGARMHYAVPRILNDAGLLERLHTDSYAGNKLWLRSILSCVPHIFAPKGLHRWLGRVECSLPGEKVQSSELLGFWYAFARKFARTHEQWYSLNRNVSKQLVKNIGARGLDNSDAVYAFDYSAKELFEIAMQNNKHCILEQTVLPRQIHFKLIREETERWPGWQPKLKVPELDSISLEREQDELNAADTIVTGSEFVKDSLISIGVDAKKINVIPYGIDTTQFEYSQKVTIQNRKLRILFAGEVGLRKGVPYLLEAVRKIGADKVDLRLAGTIKISSNIIATYQRVATFLGPVARSSMSELYRWADIFVLPSIVEGSATVTYEALLSGTPVITTVNAGSIVDSGVDGLIINAQDTNALIQAIEKFVTDGDLVTKFSLQAKRKATLASLKRYNRDLLELINRI